MTRGGQFRQSIKNLLNDSIQDSSPIIFVHQDKPTFQFTMNINIVLHTSIEPYHVPCTRKSALRL